MVTAHVESILIVTGAATATTLALVFAPSWMFRHIYGEPLPGDALRGMTRHWGLLLFCVGMLLIYSAYHPAIRKPTMVLASVEKAGFFASVFGTSLRHKRIPSLMAIGDATMALLYILYLFGY
jgi:hypothetical protein